MWAGAVALLLVATTLVAVSAPAQAATGTPVVGVASGLCLDVTGNSTALKTRVIVWTCNNQANQAWTFTA
ncbi:MAG: RICIN domain-containing protein, partial [Actinomycetota bacterium]|nr:RICIN domain-containing protein [Actinomycetota bacterium]